MSYLIVYLIIWTTVILISGTFIAVIARRLLMKARYKRLDSERERCAGLLAALDAGMPVTTGLSAYRARPGSAAYRAVEEVLHKALGNPVCGKEAGRLLEELGYADQYIRTLRSGKRWARAFAAEKLGDARCRRAVPYLVEALASANRDLRQMAVYALGEIRDDNAIPHLTRLLRRTVASGEEASMRILKSALISFGDIAVRDLIGLLDDQDWMVRAAALEILAEIGEGAPVHEFMRMLGDDEDEVRAKAAKGLGKLRSREAVAALAASIEDTNWVVRLHSARALGLIGDTAVIPALKKMLCDKNWQVRSAVSEAMRRLGEDAIVEMLNAYIDFTDKYGKDQALDELGRMGIFRKLMSFLPRLEANESALKELAVSDEKERIDAGSLAKMLLILSTLGEDRLFEVLTAISGGESEEEVKGAVPRIKALNRKAAYASE